MNLPETTRAMVLTGHGGLDKLEYHEDWLDASRSRYFGSEFDGGYADFTCNRNENAIRIETSQSDAELAQIRFSTGTAQILKQRLLRPQPAKSTLRSLLSVAACSCR